MRSDGPLAVWSQGKMEKKLLLVMMVGLVRLI